MHMPPWLLESGYFSMTVTCMPRLAHSMAVERPPNPAPITSTLNGFGDAMVRCRIKVVGKGLALSRSVNWVD